MATKKSTTKSQSASVEQQNATIPLIIEAHPRDYTGFPFITLIQYRKAPMLVIVDNVDDDVIRAYVLDLCGPERINEEAVISVAATWYAENRSNYPISIEFSRQGMTPMTSKVYRALNIEFVSRVIGPVPKYPMGTVKSIKRRRRKAISSGVTIDSVSSSDEMLED